ncbi:MAG: octaprenyl diphosphate synthase [Thiohalomonadales bacterium]
MLETATKSPVEYNPNEINEVYDLVESDMQAVNQLIETRLYSEVALINQLSHYIINSGGKRLRPILLLLSARAFGYSDHYHRDLAAIVEFIHTATLLHDDVVDASDKRRGNETANAIWGNEAAVLVGDFLYSRSFQMMVKIDDRRVLSILADATNTIAEGEVLQLLNCNNPDTTEQSYMDVIHCKTAKLFEAAAQLGSVISKAQDFQETAMANYGMYLGTAFQLIDDVLDYSSSSEEMGKNVGDDLAEGKPTLPLIRAMSVGNKQQRDVIRHAIEQGGRENIDEVIQAIRATGAIEYTAAKATEESLLAIDKLKHIPASPYRDAMITLARFSVNRNY